MTLQISFTVKILNHKRIVHSRINLFSGGYINAQKLSKYLHYKTKRYIVL
ncbi:hypothetical protein BBO01nite_22170 [Brevibacillus borstelensis]|nr:hypothetical protein BBO01nite_22170 [Brevibacillus borstelensis]